MAGEKGNVFEMSPLTAESFEAGLKSENGKPHCAIISPRGETIAQMMESRGIRTVTFASFEAFQVWSLNGHNQELLEVLLAFIVDDDTSNKQWQLLQEMAYDTGKRVVTRSVHSAVIGGRDTLWNGRIINNCEFSGKKVCVGWSEEDAIISKRILSEVGFMMSDQSPDYVFVDEETIPSKELLVTASMLNADRIKGKSWLRRLPHPAMNDYGNVFPPASKMTESDNSIPLARFFPLYFANGCAKTLKTDELQVAHAPSRRTIILDDPQAERTESTYIVRLSRKLRNVVVDVNWLKVSLEKAHVEDPTNYMTRLLATFPPKSLTDFSNNVVFVFPDLQPHHVRAVLRFLSCVNCEISKKIDDQVTLYLCADGMHDDEKPEECVVPFNRFKQYIESFQDGSIL